MNIFELQKELAKPNASNKLIKLATDIKVYNQLKSSFYKTQDVILNQLSYKTQTYLLLTAVGYSDVLFGRALLSTFDYNQITEPKAKLALGRYFELLNQDAHVVQFMLPLFHEKYLTQAADYEILFGALKEMAMHQQCDAVMIDALKKFPDIIGFKIYALSYQLSIRHLYPRNNEFIINNVNFLMTKSKKHEHYAALAFCVYNAGDPNRAYSLYDRALGMIELSDIVNESLGSFNPTSVLDSMNEIIDILESQNKKPFPAFGSLLGLVRDGKLMDYDKDADIGLYVENYQELFSLVSLICQKDYFFAPSMIKDPKESHWWNVSITNKKTGAVVDIFFFHRLDNNDYAGVYTHNAVIKWQFKPLTLTRVTLVGKEYWIPENPEAHLEEVYGDWRTPISVWDSLLNCPNLTKDSKLGSLSFSLERLYNSILKKNLNKFDNYYNTLTQRWGYQFSPETNHHLLSIRSQLVAENKENMK